MLSLTERRILGGMAISAVVAAVLHEAVQIKELGGALQAQLLQDHYEVLGIPETATQAEITKAYKRQSTSFQARPNTEDGRAKRQKVVAAYEILSRPTSRAAYDARRHFITYSSQALSVACVVLPVLAVIYLTLKLMRYWGSRTGYCVDPSSFDGKVVATFKRMQTVVRVELGKPAGEKLGMQLVPAANGSSSLQVASVVPGSVVDAHNVVARSHIDQRHVGWHTQEILAGDCVIAVNGVADPHQMTGVIGSATSLQFEVRRTLGGFLPWICEADLNRASAEERWGCQMAVASDGSGTIEVLGVDPSGVLERWNREHPTRRICVGDRIVSVNKELGSAKMLASLQDGSVHSSCWIFVRGVKAEDRAPEVTSGPLRKQAGEKLGIRIGAVLESPVRGAIVELGEGAAVVVKEVVPGYLVDAWNQAHPAQKVFDGAAVLSVNGNTNPAEFAKELGKPTVTLRTRPPRGAKLDLSAARPEAPPKQLDLSEPAQGRGSAGSSWLPRFCRPRSFEVRLRDMLAKLRCEYMVELSRGTDGKKVGLSIDRCRELGGLVVTAVQPDGLVEAYNAALTDGCVPGVRPNDALINVNGVSVPQLMIEQLANQQVEALSLRFSRKPADAAPGIWEASVERAPGEGWGMQLKEQPLTQGSRGHGPILIEEITAGLAIDRWNADASPAKTWPVRPGDLIVGCEDEVGHDKVLAKLKGSQRVRLTLLRWHAGPAPGADDEERTVYRLTVRKSEPTEKLGISMGPCARNPTRTVLTSIKEGGLVDQHNKSEAGGSGSEADQPIAREGDEVLAVNGQRDSSRFLEACAANVVELECRRGRGSSESAVENRSQTPHRDPAADEEIPVDAGESHGHGTSVRAPASPQESAVPPTPPVDGLSASAGPCLRDNAPAPPDVQQAVPTEVQEEGEVSPSSGRVVRAPATDEVPAPLVARAAAPAAPVSQPPPVVAAAQVAPPPTPSPAAAITPFATRSMLAPGTAPAEVEERDELEQLKLQLAQARAGEERATRENRALKLEAQHMKAQLEKARMQQENSVKESAALRAEKEQLKAQMAASRRTRSKTTVTWGSAVDRLEHLSDSLERVLASDDEHSDDGFEYDFS